MAAEMARNGADQYYIVIGRHPMPEATPDLHLVGKPRLPAIDSFVEIADRAKNLYLSVLEPSLFEKRHEARGVASFLVNRGFLDVEVCAVVPLRKFVREPKLVEEPMSRFQVRQGTPDPGRC